MAGLLGISKAEGTHPHLEPFPSFLVKKWQIFSRRKKGEKKNMHPKGTLK
jgi:hypothetical protein